MPADETYGLLNILADLKKIGFQQSLIVNGGRALHPVTRESFTPEQVKLAGIYRVEGDSNNDEEAVVYALTSTSGTKGLIIDSFGPHADPEIADFMSKVKPAT